MNTYEDRRNMVTSYENVIPLKSRVDTYADDIEIVEPKVVVEVQYDDISCYDRSHYRITSHLALLQKGFRAMSKKFIWAQG